MRSIRRVSDDEIQETALAALANVVRATPVGNPTRWQNPASAPPGYVGGHARRNWLVTIDRRSDATVGAPGRGPGLAGATQEAISDGEAQIRRARRPRFIVIQNAVPYIGRLNAGHSTAAPANFVEKAVQAARITGSGGREPLP
jgi:hypothetical protein